MTPTSDTRLSTTQAARFLGMSTPTLRQLLKTGQIPYTLVGTHHRLRLEDLDTYTEKGGWRPSKRWVRRKSSHGADADDAGARSQPRQSD